MKLKITHIAPVIILCSLMITGVAVIARRQLLSLSNGKPNVKVNLSGLVKRQDKEMNLTEAGKVNPGEKLTWIITSENDGTGAARDYKAVGQIPAGTSFVAGSAKAEAGATIIYSIDDGKSFSPQPMIEEKQADG